MNSDTMGAPNSFSARRPNASNLPHFELPSPHLGAFSKYGQACTNCNNVANAGQLLTPPTGSSMGSTGDGISPAKNVNHVQQPAYPYTPTGQSWPATTHQQAGANSYAFPAVTSPGALNNTSRGDFFQSNPHSMLRRSETMPGPTMQPQSPFGETHAFSSSMHMPAPLTLPNLQTSLTNHMGAHPPHSASLTPNDFGRAMHSAGFYSSAQPSPAASYGAHFSSGPSPTTQTPSDQSLPRHSPSILGAMPPLYHAQTTTPPANFGHRPFFHSLPGPIGGIHSASSPTAQLGMGGAGFPGLSTQYGQSLQMHHQLGGNASHMMLNDRPFRCDQCPQSFNRNHDLKRHKRIHLAVKPFPCGHCDKSFSRKDALKRHILVKGCGKGVRAPAASGSDDELNNSEGSVSPTSPDVVRFDPIGGQAPVPHSA